MRPHGSQRALRLLGLLVLLVIVPAIHGFVLPLPSTAAVARRAVVVVAAAAGGAAGSSSSSSSNSEEMPNPRKMDKRWQKKRRRVELGPDGLPVAPVHAPRQMRSNKDTTSGGSQRRRLRPQGKAMDMMATPSRLRIIGGTARGKKLDSPPVHLRPMMGKVREALFSQLVSFDLFAGQRPPRVLDLFCGAGSVGLEALSRGAGEAVFVDLAAECCACVERNLQGCGFEGKGTAVRSRAEEALRDPGRLGVTGTFDLVSITPPYEEVVYADLIRDVMNSPAVTEDTLVVIEYPVELGSLPFNIGEGRMLGLRNRRYGRTVLAVYAVRPTGKRSGELRPEEFDFAPTPLGERREEGAEGEDEEGE